MKRIMLCMAVMIGAICILTGCKGKRAGEAKKLASDYIAELAGKVDDNTVRLTDAEPGQFGELYSFTAHSDKYADDFMVNVNGDDSVTDTYFSVALGDAANAEFDALLHETLPGTEIEYEVAPLKNIVALALSGKVFDSVYEACKAYKHEVVYVTLKLPNSETVDETDLAKILHAMQDSGYYAKLHAIGDYRDFEVNADGIWYMDSDPGPGYVETHIYEK